MPEDDSITLHCRCKRSSSEPMRRHFHIPLALLILAAIGARAWLLFSTPHMPGVNGAYYLVQARSLLEKGALGLPDMPLTFALHAALAKLISWFNGGNISAAIVLAVKLADAVLPPIAAWPVWWLAAVWCERRGQSRTLALVPAGIVVLSSPLLVMVGDLQKNSLAFVWLAGLIAIAAAFLQSPNWKRALALLACLALVGLTHVGVLGSALLFAACLAMSVAVLQNNRRRLKLLPWAGAAVVVVALAAVVVMWKFDPSRIHRLAEAFTLPGQFFGDNMSMPGSPGGPQNGFHLLRWLAVGLFAMCALPALILVWRERAVLAASDAAVVAGCAFTVLAMSGHWVEGDTAVRFYLIAIVPAALCGTFALLHIGRTWIRWTVAGALSLLLCGPSVPQVLRGGQPALSDSALAELSSLRAFVPQPGRTLICAQHGVEWWTAWLLHTHIAQPSGLRASDWQLYATVLFLQSKTILRHLPPPKAAVRIPADAVILHDGPCFILARVASTPSSVNAESAIRWPSSPVVPNFKY